MEFTEWELQKIVEGAVFREWRRRPLIHDQDFPSDWLRRVVKSMYAVQPVLTRSRFVHVLDAAIGRRFDGVESAVIAGTVYEPRP